MRPQSESQGRTSASETLSSLCCGQNICFLKWSITEFCVGDQCRFWVLRKKVEGRCVSLDLIEKLKKVKKLWIHLEKCFLAGSKLNEFRYNTGRKHKWKLTKTWILSLSINDWVIIKNLHFCSRHEYCALVLCMILQKSQLQLTWEPRHWNNKILKNCKNKQVCDFNSMKPRA